MAVPAKKILLRLALTGLFLSVVACKKASEDSAPQVADDQVDRGQVLARVNGEDITEADVSNMINRTFNVAEQLAINREVEKKVLESLVASRAMRQVVEKEMTDQERYELQLKVKAYEEELYIKEYMNRHVVPQPVTTAMVKEYYDNHPERFGGGVLKTFEMLKPRSTLNEEQRDRLLASVAKIKASKDWAALAKTLDSEIEMVHLSTRATPDILTDDMARVLRDLQVGETSGFVYENNIPVIYRVTREEKIPPKPLAEVSVEIRKMLAPLNLKKAVKEETEKVISQADVEYVVEQN